MILLRKRKGETKRRKQQTNLKKGHKDDSETTYGEDNAACLFCHQLFSEPKSEEGWIKCTRCNGWAHEHCAGIDEKDDDIMYICDFCN
jgi:hypothetical protein